MWRLDVVGDLEDLGKALLLDGAVVALDWLAGDQLFPVAEPAVRRARRDDIQEAHLVLVYEAFDGAVVHLVAGVLSTIQVEGLIGRCLDELLELRAVLGHLEKVAGDLHRHPRLDVPLGTPDLEQLLDFGGAVESQHVVGGSAVDKGIKAIEDLAVIPGIFDRVEDQPLPFRRLVFCSCHGRFRPPLASVSWGTAYQ